MSSEPVRNGGLTDGPGVDLVREVHRRFPTGVTVVTTQTAEGPRGLAVNAFCSVSLEPPVIMVCVAESASTHDPLFLGDHLAVNVLSHTQAGLAQRFARSGGAKFAGLSWHAGRFGSPILRGASGYLEAVIQTRLPAYTHTVFLGRVLDGGFSAAPPLIYLEGSFFHDPRQVPVE